jgi:hypothetical protein
MGAFDGYWGWGGNSNSFTGVSKRAIYPYFSNQSSFEFFKGFEMPELKALLAEAERDGDDTIWVPQEQPGQGRKGLKTWYVRALIKEYDDTGTN